ncbi:membrane protein insertase YidC [Calycomorphotria hydatis]|uniref:Membrane protein insertase YidC n=1 Tax=Calycomorphotria hydatis TaxID=2528027 RepID=A0A517T4H6_9PLAN|nr:membrane protein insertase YidC [Calycomorphotria hydatis]QDT63282.1 Membrane protein insertase YidC [Calycomorphotria hydatis]
MDQQKRLMLFLVLSSAVIFGWGLYQQRMNPPVPPGLNKVADRVPRDRAPIEAPRPGDLVVPEVVGVPKHERKQVKLGSLDPESGYYMEAIVSTEGASLFAVELNDPRYRDLDSRDLPLKVIGTGDPRKHTLSTRFKAIDAQLPIGESSETIDWEVVKVEADAKDKGVNHRVVMRLQSPDGSIEARKSYTLRRADEGDAALGADANPAGYMIDVAIGVKNLGGRQETITYELQGPTGLPLENQDHTRKYRDLELGFLEPGGGFNSETMSASDVLEEVKKALDARLLGNAAALEEWRTPLRYAGVEVQYFTALLFPQRTGNATPEENPIIAVTTPDLVEEHADKEEFSDISLRFTSEEMKLEPGQEKSHQYQLFAGPKRKDLLKPIGADSVMDLGWFWFVSEPMLWLLHQLHNFGIPYGIAIILLTIMVRSCMYPLSKKQAISAARMKELQPKIEELKKKYGDDREKMGRAQMELFAKEGINPIGGCLPILLQLPIFIGLYQALSNSVDLRMAEFLWVDNLAAPDQLFHFPFTIPLLNTSAFNLLPIIAAVLMYFQQKLFMPPATSPEQEMQYKMMSFMPIMMGFFFYHVPAGLCVYFISSSLWSVAERKLLEKHRDPGTSPGLSPTTDSGPSPKPGSGGKQKKDDPPKQTFWTRLMDAAEDARKQAELNANQNRDKGNTNGRGGGRRKKSRK